MGLTSCSKHKVHTSDTNLMQAPRASSRASTGKDFKITRKMSPFLVSCIIVVWSEYKKYI